MRPLPWLIALACCNAALADELARVKPANVKIGWDGDDVPAKLEAEASEAKFWIDGKWPEEPDPEQFPKLMVRIPLHVPKDFTSVTGDEDVTVTPGRDRSADLGYREFIVTSPIDKIDGGEIDLTLTDESDEKNEVQLQIAGGLLSEQIVMGPTCDNVSVDVASESGVKDPFLLLMHCQRRDSEDVVAVKAFVRQKVRTDQPPPSGSGAGWLRWSVARKKLKSESPAEAEAEGAENRSVIREPDGPKTVRFRIGGSSDADSRKYILTFNEDKPTRWWGYGQVGLFAGEQSGAAGNDVSLEGAWIPTFPLNSKLSIRTWLGLAFLKDVDTGPFPMLSAEAYLSHSGLLPGMTVEAGAGLHMWIGNPIGTNPAFTARVALPIRPRLMKLFDRVSIGYTFLSNAIHSVHELRCGLGVAI